MEPRSTSSAGRWLSGIALCLLVGLSVTDGVKADGPPLNIVFILADDLGWTDLRGPNLGPHTSDYYETPNLNKLAGQGMRFTNAYANPSCTPSRASLLTGRYAAALHLTANSGQPKRKILREPKMNFPLPLEQVTIAEGLQAAGYTTGLFGKWHLSKSHLASAQAVQQGFETYGVRSDLPKQGDWDHHRVNGLTDKATQFIEQNKDNPFFMLLAHKAVHWPLRTRPDLLAKYEAKSPGTHHSNPKFAGMVEQLDESVGAVVAKIDSLGLTDNTLIIFSSDNGAAITSSSNHPLRGGKYELYEGGIRVPTIFRLPGVIDAGSVADTPIVVPDYVPTILDLAGVTQSNSNQLDGESLVPLLTKAGDLRRQPIFWHFPHYGRMTTPVGAIRQGDWKLLEFFENGHLELYDLTVDLGEQHNLAASMPEKAASLHAALKMWQKQVGAEMPTINPNWQASQYAGRLKWAWDGGDAGDKAHQRWDTTIFPNPIRSKPEFWKLKVKTREVDAPKLVPVSTHFRAFPTHAYDFDGADNGMYFNGEFTVSSADQDNDSASFEIWFKMDQLQDTGQILFETGSAKRGLSLTIGNANAGDKDGNNDDLHLRVSGGGAKATMTIDLSQYADPSRDFMQVVAVTKDSGFQNRVSLYLNGAKFDQVNLGNTDLDWDSKRGAGLGLAQGQVGASGRLRSLPFPLTDFEGQIAMFRFYNQSLTEAQVLKIYNYALGPPDQHITSAAGFVEIPEERPASVDAGECERNDILLFHERQTTLTEDLHVDLLASAIGATIDNHPTQDTGSAVIAADTGINSYFLHFDPVGDPTDLVDANITIRFDDEILGVITATDLLMTSDFILGVVGKYSKAPWRGLELDALEGVMLFDDHHSLMVNLTAIGQDLDHLRVITAASVVPLPASWWMGLALLIACAAIAKFHKNARLGCSWKDP